MTSSVASERALFSRLDRMFAEAQNNMLTELHALMDEIQRLDGDVNDPATSKEIKRLLKKHNAERIIGAGVAAVGAAASAAIAASMVGESVSSAKEATEKLQAQAKTDLGLLELGVAAAVVNAKETRQEKQSQRKLASNSLALSRSKNAINTALHRVKEPADFLPLAIGLSINKTRMHARTLIRTEQTHMRGYATEQIGKAAAALGVKIYKQWHCRMRVNSRDPHKERNGMCALIDEPFAGSVMHYPGDPAGGAGEVCNCLCHMTLHVLGANDRIIDGRLIRGRK